MTHKTLIYFFDETGSFILKNKSAIKKIIIKIINDHKKESGPANFIFCNDKYLLNLNKTYLHRNTLTDIIAFDYSENNSVSGDIFISIDRVKENAKSLKLTFHNELSRIIIHGTLHLCGYNDNTAKEKISMRKKEDTYLQRF